MQKLLLNVGGNSKAIDLPACYSKHKHILLDIDATACPDIVCDARQLMDLKGGRFDVVYCSHNLEHYYAHEISWVLDGFMHVLKDSGFLHVRVPDIIGLMKWVVEKNLDIEDVVYQSPAGPITIKDILYGYGRQIEASGEDFFAHKTGFSDKSLEKSLVNAGFSHIYLGTQSLEVSAIAFKGMPLESDLILLGLIDSHEG